MEKKFDLLNGAKTMRKTEIVSVNGVEDLRKIWRVTPEVNRERCLEGKEYNDITQKLTDHILRGVTLSEVETDILESLFPLEVSMEAIENKDIPAGGTWDLGTSKQLTVHHIGTLTVGQGATIIASNTPIALTVDNVIAAGDFTFKIHGVEGQKGADKTAPAKPPKAGSGSNGTCSSSGVSDKDGERGSNGATGTQGLQGNYGADGLPAMPAKIVIKSIKSTMPNIKIIIDSKSGAGGVGGTGSDGGAGGDGGNGGDGATCLCTGSRGGTGGAGGNGGKGGTGGTGGNGVDANMIDIYVPNGFGKSIKIITAEALPGKGGKGGKGGAAGAGGSGGAAGKHNDGGASGASGTEGAGGEEGKAGRYAGKPAQITITENHAVTFLDYDKTILEVQQVADGRAAIAPKPPEHEGYVFKNWSCDFSNIKADTVVTAVYEATGAQVTFLNEDKTVLGVVIADGEGKVVPLAAPWKDGYLFRGWGQTTIGDTNFNHIVASITVFPTYLALGGQETEYILHDTTHNENICKNVTGKAQIYNAYINGDVSLLAGETNIHDVTIAGSTALYANTVVLKNLFFKKSVFISGKNISITSGNVDGTIVIEKASASAVVTISDDFPREKVVVLYRQ